MSLFIPTQKIETPDGWICSWVLGNMQVPDSDITVRHGHVAETIIMQCRCLDELVLLQKQKLLVATPTLANQQPLL